MNFGGANSLGDEDSREGWRMVGASSFFCVMEEERLYLKFVVRVNVC